MVKLNYIMIDKPSGFGKMDIPLPGEFSEVDRLMLSLQPGSLVIATYKKPLHRWAKFLKSRHPEIQYLVVSSQNNRILTDLMIDNNIPPDYVILATDTVTYGTSFDLYNVLVLLDLPWSRGKFLQRIYRVIRRGSDLSKKIIYIIGTSKKLEYVRKKFSIASLIEHVNDEFYNKSW